MARGPGGRGDRLNVGRIRDRVAWCAEDLRVHARCTCGEGCREVGLMCPEHGEGHMAVAFDHDEAVLLVACAECERLLAKVKVAPGRGMPKAVGGVH